MTAKRIVATAIAAIVLGCLVAVSLTLRNSLSELTMFGSAVIRPEPSSSSISSSQLAPVHTEPANEPTRNGYSCRGIAPIEERLECVGESFMVRFEAEGRDQSWASGAEGNILAGMTQIAELSGVTSLNVECREMLCRLIIAFPTVDDLARVIADPSPGEMNAFVSDVLLPMTRQAGLGPAFIPYPRETNLPERTYYLVR